MRRSLALAGGVSPLSMGCRSRYSRHGGLDEIPERGGRPAGPRKLLPSPAEHYGRMTMKMDWKHIALGLIGVVIPPAIHFLAGVDWNSLGPTWATAILGALQLGNEYFSNKA